MADSLSDFLDMALPDLDLRRDVLSCLASSIRLANGLSPACWSLGVRDRGAAVRLNCGRTEVFVIHSEGINLLFDAKKPPATGRLIGRHSDAPAAIYWQFAPSDFRTAYEDLREAHLRALQSTERRSSHARTHQPKVVAFLRKFLAQPDLPDPVYGTRRGRDNRAVSANGDDVQASSEHQLLSMLREVEEAAEPFNPNDIADGRLRVLASLVQRRGQSDFRRALLSAYGGRCAVSGCAVEEVLEAAHILPYLGPETNHVQNGLLLRADVHALFDLGRIWFDPDTLALQLHPSLAGTEYAQFKGRPLRLPSNKRAHPSRKALRKRRAT